jgi:hypothetical protein
MRHTRHCWFFIALLCGLNCLSVSADDAAHDRSQTAILTATLALLNLSHPIADLDANLARGDKRFVGINGYTCAAPGISDDDYSIVHSGLHGIHCLAGTSDNVESNKHKMLIDKASEYARVYNTELLKRIRARTI